MSKTMNVFIDTINDNWIKSQDEYSDYEYDSMFN